MSHTLEQDFQHFMAYTNSDPADEAKLRFAYEHGASRNERDAERWRFLVRENNKGGRGKFRIVWLSGPGGGYVTTDGVSVDGKDDEAIIRIIDASMKGETP